MAYRYMHVGIDVPLRMAWLACLGGSRWGR
jgi:hypothetical protein